MNFDSTKTDSKPNRFNPTLNYSLIIDKLKIRAIKTLSENSFTDCGLSLAVRFAQALPCTQKARFVALGFLPILI